MAKIKGSVASSLRLLSAAGTIVVVNGLPCETHNYPPATSPPLVGNFTDKLGGVACEADVCSTIGIELLRQGGSAADAAVGTVLCVGTVSMYHSGIGGGGFMLVHKGSSLTDGSPYEFIDFRETAPAAATENMYKNDVDASMYGGKASGVPGELRGLEHLHNQYGRLPWATLVEPSIRLARYGFPVTEDLMKYMRQTYKNSSSESYLVRDPAWAVDFAPKGKLLQIGEKMTRKRYADALEAIAEGGADAFYEGAIAEATIKALKDKNGIMTTEDLEKYEVVVREPAQINYKGGKITSGSVPSSGVVAATVLKILEGYDFIGDAARVNESTHLIDEAMKFSYGMRTKLGDPSFVEGLTKYQKQMLSEQTAEEVRGKITGRALNLSAYDPEGLESLNTPGTSHIVAMDGSGMAVSLTTTVNLIFGSRVMVPKTGIVMNNEMNDFSIPGSSNAFGYIPSKANFIRPGKRPLSSISTTIVERPDGRVWLVTGSAGGSRIITATLQVVLNVVEKGMTAAQALAAPRLHDQLVPQQITFEYGFDNSTVAYLKEIGNNVTWVAPGSSTAQAIRWGEDGRFDSSGEPRQVNSGGFNT